MKFRTTLALLAIVAGLAFGISALPGEAHAATAVTLSDTDRSNIQSVLDLTQATLDTVQLQINRNEIRDRQATLATLGNIRTYLLNMRELLGGAPVSMLIEEPEPVAPQAPVAFSPQPAPQPAAPTATEPAGEVAGSAVVGETEPNRQTASVSSSASSRRAFWIILITAIVIAIILAIPRRKDIVTLQSVSQHPTAKLQTPQQTPDSKESETIQSA